MRKGNQQEAQKRPQIGCSSCTIYCWTCAEFPSSTALRTCSKSEVVSTSTMCRLLASHGLTHKKIQHVALQSLLDPSVASTYPFSRNMFVYVAVR